MSQSIAAFEQDVAPTAWQRPAYTAAIVEQKAEELSAAHSATLVAAPWTYPCGRSIGDWDERVYHVR